ncbi:Late embryogenesis abundant protein [Forsythia ovata]|uniref:Late embryogenesis abundant protein n=1 Tax=Forsythia ovata TaxID=205694 RepID=A0ABD1QPJ4_9LAMI
MGVPMHAKSDSEVTSIEASTPPRSPRRPLYYVQSPSHSQHDLEKMSYGSSPFGSPTHHYHCSPIHHSRESSTSRFSASLKNPRNAVSGWRRIQRKYDEMGDEEDNEERNVEDDRSDGGNLRFFVVCFLFSFVVLFTVFSLILWAASVPYKPKIIVKNIAFENFNVQAGMDGTGVPTDMLTLNSTVKILYRNTATFFGVHVTSTPIEFHYFDLKLASGHMKKFYQSRKSQRTVIALVQGYQVPLYGGIPVLSGAKGHLESVSVPLNLTFVMRSRAYILGRLVKPKFYRSILCEVTLRSNHLGKPVNLTRSGSCVYK